MKTFVGMMDTKFKLVVTLEEKGKRRELETIHKGFSCILNILFQFIKKISSKDGKMLRFATLSGRCMDVNSNCFIYFFWFLNYLLFSFLWLHRVLVVACGIFRCSAHIVSSCGIQAQFLHSILVFRPGIKTMFPALQSGFSTTGPPEESSNF